MLAVTGANGHLGRRLLRELASQGPVKALVRSRAAVAQVNALGLGDTVAVYRVDYGDAAALTTALTDCRAVVHLVGIIKETAGNSYRAAHEAAATALAEAAAGAGVGHIVHLSIVGASAASRNACLASRGRAEDILVQGVIAATIIRVPMVLGQGDFASAALTARAHRAVNLTLRGSSREQPIYAGDVTAALRAALAGGAHGILDLAGPESLSRSALTHRAAATVGRQTRVVSLPLALGLAVAGVLERVSVDPPVTRTMLEVLDHDDDVDVQPALAALGLTLTALDETLRLCIDPEAVP